MAFVSVPPLKTRYGWHGASYPAGATSIPESLAIALGLSSKTEKSISQNAALTLINEATEVDKIEVLPGIGSASASRIFAARPAQGFETLEAVALVDDLPLSIDWNAVEAWSPDE
ncbi:MAG: hypothetical protein ACFB14_20800 [Leptolyngbyaceae cyanobacterium]